jgi:hypothetical protein
MDRCLASFTSALYFTRSWHCRTVASALHRGRVFSLPPPVSSHFRPPAMSRAQAHFLRQLASSTRGTCFSATVLFKDHFSGGHNFKLAQLYGGPLRGKHSSKCLLV